MSEFVDKFSRGCRNCDVCVTGNVFNRIKYLINENTIFTSDIDYFNQRCLDVIKYIVINISNGLTSTEYTICGISLYDENILYRMITSNYKVAEKAIYRYIKRNVTLYNYNFDSWTPIFETDLSIFKYEPNIRLVEYISRETGEPINNISRPLSFNDVNDVIYRLYSITHESDFEMEPEVAQQFFNSISNVINELQNHIVHEDDDQFDILFENNRNIEINENYNFSHKEHKLNIHNDKNIHASDDINTCLLCYESSDYVCSKCGFPICNDCMNKLRLQLHIRCPNCRNEPMEFYNIENRCKFNKAKR